MWIIRIITFQDTRVNVGLILSLSLIIVALSKQKQFWFALIYNPVCQLLSCIASGS